MKRIRWMLCGSLLLLLSVTAGMAQDTSAPEFRSLHITAWSSGFESDAATTTMVNYATAGNLNVIIPEVRLRADAYYTSTIEPPGTGIIATPVGYDSLAECLAKAHPLGIEVHPWVVTYRIWTNTTGPGHTTPEHLWWTHGPGNTDPTQDWLMYSDTGAWDYNGTVNLDPGIPAVEDYLVSVFLDIVTRYNVDGLSLDYIRYPSINYGYNPVSIQRFNTEYGRSGNPPPTDTTWQNWRRDQVTNLVKRLYLEIKAVKPQVELGASVWNYWSTGYSTYLQDWDSWMRNHWIDYVQPMTYSSNNTTFSGWLDDAVNRQYGRYVYPLVDTSLNISSNVLPQIDLVRQHGFSGLGLYAYNSIPDRSALQSALVSGPFPTSLTPADMPWGQRTAMFAFLLNTDYWLLTTDGTRVPSPESRIPAIDRSHLSPSQYRDAYDRLRIADAAGRPRPRHPHRGRGERTLRGVRRQPLAAPHARGRALLHHDGRE